MTMDGTVRRMSLALMALAIVATPASTLAQTFSESRAAAPAESTDDIDLNLTAGGMLNYGNANAGGVNAAGGLTIHEGMELFVAEVSYAWGIAGTFPTCGDVRAGLVPDPIVGGTGFCGTAMAPTMQPASARAGDASWRESASNLNWRLRYDHFFDADNALFVAHRGRMDYFAGLDLRLGLQLGYNRMLFREENHTLALDVGVDATIDIYSQRVRDQNHALVDMGTALPNLAGTDGRIVPALRVQLAYVNHLNSVFTYDTTFEALWDVPNPEHFRFEWVNHLRSAIDTWLQVSLDVTFRLDSLPPGQAASWRERFGQTTTMFDLLTTLNLVGNFDLDGEPPSPEEPPAAAEPTCPDCPTCPAPEAVETDSPTEPSGEPAAEGAESAPAPTAETPPG